MRQLVVSVPHDREDLVLEVLQDTCGLKNITRHEDVNSTTYYAYVAAYESGIALHELDKVGCGTAYGKVALLPVHIIKPLPNFRERPLHDLVKQSKWTLRGRMAVEEIYIGVLSGTELSFDYLAFLCIAGFISAVGLATDSAVMIVASMLLSPLMGPIMAFTFGTSVQDRYLVWKGILSEAVGVLTTFLIGFLTGLVVSGWQAVADYYDWPTGEMASRGDLSGLVVGVFFAIPSGAGVALCTTQGGGTSLVGVAIAASLMVPVVNVGLNLGYAVAGAHRAGRSVSRFLRIAGLSLALYAINVACIYAVCILFFWIKGIKKVRKQLLRYNDLPPLPSKLAKAGSSGRVIINMDGSKPISPLTSVGSGGLRTSSSGGAAPAAAAAVSASSGQAAAAATATRAASGMDTVFAQAAGTAAGIVSQPSGGSRASRALSGSVRSVGSKSSRGSSKLFRLLRRKGTGASMSSSLPEGAGGQGEAVAVAGSGVVRPGEEHGWGRVRWAVRQRQLQGVAGEVVVEGVEGEEAVAVEGETAVPQGEEGSRLTEEKLQLHTELLEAQQQQQQQQDVRDQDVISEVEALSPTLPQEQQGMQQPSQSWTAGDAAAAVAAAEKLTTAMTSLSAEQPGWGTAAQSSTGVGDRAGAVPAAAAAPEAAKFASAEAGGAGAGIGAVGKVEAGEGAVHGESLELKA